MAFLTADEVRTVRLRGAKRLPIAGTSRALMLVKMSSANGLAMTKLQATADSPDAQATLFRFLLTSSCTDEHGNLLSAEDAEQPVGDVLVDATRQLRIPRALRRDRTKVDLVGKLEGRHDAIPIVVCLR